MFRGRYRFRGKAKFREGYRGRDRAQVQGTVQRKVEVVSGIDTNLCYHPSIDMPY